MQTHEPMVTSHWKHYSPYNLCLQAAAYQVRQLFLCLLHLEEEEEHGMKRSLGTVLEVDYPCTTSCLILRSDRGCHASSCLTLFRQPAISTQTPPLGSVNWTPTQSPSPLCCFGQILHNSQRNKAH